MIGLVCMRKHKYKLWDCNYWKKNHEHPDGPSPNAKPKECGDWVDGDDILDTLDLHEGCDDLVLHPPPGYILVEYTGLKDKKGVEIYDGDYVTVDMLGKPMKALIVWAGGGFVIKFYKDGYGDAFGDGWAGKAEVVGNVHEEAA